MGEEKSDCLHLSDMENSALSEIGNIMIGSYMAAIAALSQSGDQDFRTGRHCRYGRVTFDGPGRGNGFRFRQNHFYRGRLRELQTTKFRPT